MKTQQAESGVVMAKEIPIPLVRANQTMLIIGTVAALLLQNRLIVLVLFVITIATLLFGPRINPAFRIVRPLLGHRLFFSPTESVEIQRFNQVIATVCLGLATGFLFAGSQIGWLFNGFVTIAASAAVCGYCIGCRVYYPYKMWVRRMRTRFPKLTPLFDFIAGTGKFQPPLQLRPQPMLLMGLAHVAIRSQLDDLEKQAASLTPENLEGFVHSVRSLARGINHHAHQEDAAMYPPFDAKRAGITKPFTDEHGDVHDLAKFEAALAAASVDPEMTAGVSEAARSWASLNRSHLKHEEELLMPLVPKLFTYEEGAEVLKSILTVDPEEFRDNHLGFVFSRLNPGQRYNYVTILRTCCTPEEFGAYEEVMRPYAPGASWDDFARSGRMFA